MLVLDMNLRSMSHHKSVFFGREGLNIRMSVLDMHGCGMAFKDNRSPQKLSATTRRSFNTSVIVARCETSVWMGGQRVGEVQRSIGR